MNLDYAFELYYQVHQQFIQLFDTLAAGQRVTLTKAHERVLNELSLFTQQNIDFLEQTSTDVMDAVPETVAPQAQDSASVLDITDLSAQFALDKQQLHSMRQTVTLILTCWTSSLKRQMNCWWGLIRISIHGLLTIKCRCAENLMRYLHTLKGGSNMIQARHIGLIAHELKQFMRS